MILSTEVTENVPSSNPTAKAFTLTSALWFAAATSLGMIGAGYLIAPDFLANIEYIHFGRVRPMHINAVLFGFVTPGLLAVARLGLGVLSLFVLLFALTLRGG